MCNAHCKIILLQCQKVHGRLMTSNDLLTMVEAQVSRQSNAGWGRRSITLLTNLQDTDYMKFIYIYIYIIVNNMKIFIIQLMAIFFSIKHRSILVLSYFHVLHIKSNNDKCTINISYDDIYNCQSILVPSYFHVLHIK